MREAVVWHDVECGSYAADLALWRELAAAGGPVLDLGAGTGRVSLDLAEHGHEVTALDSNPDLLEELATRAAAAGVEVECMVADARDPGLDARFGLVLAPMQLLQIVGGAPERAALLSGAASALRPGGRFAAAIAAVDQSLPTDEAIPPLPDLGEHDGWVYSSQPVDVRAEAGGVAVERLRQRVSPHGELVEQLHTQRLEALSVDELERGAAESGLAPVARHVVAETADHIGSMVVVCRR